MATITLTRGDFGAGVPVTVGLAEIFLPDPARPGVVTPLPLAEISAVEALESDHSHQVREAARLSFNGFLKAGPLGLAMGVLGATRPKTVIFSVRLADGRGFVASADAATYADFHAAQVSARAGALAPSPADGIIARYLEARHAASAGSAEADTIDAVREERRRTPDLPRPAFGRRKRDRPAG